MGDPTENQPNIIETDNEANKKPGIGRYSRLTALALCALLGLAACKEDDTIPPTVHGSNVEEIFESGKIHIDRTAGTITIKTDEGKTFKLFDYYDNQDAREDINPTLEDLTHQKKYYSNNIEGIDIKPGITKWKLTCEDTSGNPGTDYATSNHEVPTPLPKLDYLSNIPPISGPTYIDKGDKCVLLGDTKIMRWDQDGCDIKLTFNGNPIDKFPFTIEQTGDIQGVLSNKAGKSEATTHVEFEGPQPPILTLLISKPTVDVSTPKIIDKDGKKLLIGGVPVLQWDQDDCEISANFAGEKSDHNINNIEFGTTSLKYKGKLNVTVKSNETGKTSTQKFDITATNNAPQLTTIDEVNIFGGAEIKINGNKLLIEGVEVASRNDDRTETANLTPDIKFYSESNPNQAIQIKDGDTINEAGNLSITVEDDEGQKSPTQTIKLTNDINKYVQGIERLNNLNLKLSDDDTPNPIDLLEGISFLNGAEFVNMEIEIDGQIYEISDPHHYIPQYPGDQCYIHLAIKLENGQIHTIKSKQLTIKPLEYTELSLDTADVINTQYAWFNNISSQSKKDFIYPHILTSYITGERYKLDNMEYIVMGEVPKYTTEYENVNIRGPNSTPDEHGDSSCAHVKYIAAPFSTIKVCGGTREDLLNYISLHPDKHFMISCARDKLSGNTLSELKGNPMYTALNAILAQKNVTASMATKNGIKYMLNENEPDRDGGYRNSSCVNSPNPNKITVSGFNTDKNNIFRDGDYVGSEPLGFSKECNNIVIPFIQLVGWLHGNDLTGTESSYATATLSGTLGNFLSIIMHNHPGITLTDANSIFRDEYLIPQNFQHKNDDGTIENAGIWYFFDTDKFTHVEILHKPEIEALQLNQEDVQLPSGKGLCYVGKGIQFEYNGRRYDATNKNRSQFMNIIANNDIKWFWNYTSRRKHGGKGDAKFDEYVVDTHGRKVPDVQIKNITKPVSNSLGQAYTFAEEKYRKDLGNYGKGIYGEIASTYGENLGGYGESNSIYGGIADSGYGEKSDSDYGGKSDSGYGGIADSGYGGKPDSGYGGIANSNSIYGGKPDSGYGGKGNHEKHLA